MENVPRVALELRDFVLRLEVAGANDADSIDFAPVDRLRLSVQVGKLDRLEKFDGSGGLSLAHLLGLVLSLRVVHVFVPVLRMLKHFSQGRFPLHAAQEYWQGNDVRENEGLRQDDVCRGRSDKRLTAWAHVCIEQNLGLL